MSSPSPVKPGSGWKEVTAKLPNPHSSYHRTSGFDLARARPLGLAAMRGEGKTGSALETGGGQELAFSVDAPVLIERRLNLAQCLCTQCYIFCKSLATSPVWPFSFDEVGINADLIARSTLRRAPTA